MEVRIQDERNRPRLFVLLKVRTQYERIKYATDI